MTTTYQWSSLDINGDKVIGAENKTLNIKIGIEDYVVTLDETTYNTFIPYKTSQLVDEIQLKLEAQEILAECKMGVIANNSKKKTSVAVFTHDTDDEFEITGSLLDVIGAIDLTKVDDANEVF